MSRSPLSRPEDIARYAEGLRRAGLPEDSLAAFDERSLLTVRHTTIDLVSGAQHSLGLDAR